MVRKKREVISCFNPRARVGRDHLYRSDREIMEQVSIHAPAWGATWFAPRRRSVCTVSIHAPAWGATSQETSCMGWHKVSIHAPAWGATDKLGIEWLPFLVSIHAPAWGATLELWRPRAAIGCFNPRARVGRDWNLSCVPARRQSFNPRARVGRDPLLLQVPQPLLVSIHAPAWGATSPVEVRIFFAHVSIHAPAWGATAQGVKDLAEIIVSIHAPAWGATVHLLFPIILHKYASLFEDVSHVCPHFRFMSVME